MKTRIVETRSIGRRPTAVVKAELDVDRLGPWLSETFSRVARYLETSHNPPVGPPFARFHRLEGTRFHVEAGFPVAREAADSDGIEGTSLPGGDVAVIRHVGPYDEMEASYEALGVWFESRGATPVGDAWEVYFSEREDPPTTWRTDIVQPYRELVADPSSPKPTPPDDRPSKTQDSPL